MTLEQEIVALGITGIIACIILLIDIYKNLK